MYNKRITDIFILVTLFWLFLFKFCYYEHKAEKLKGRTKNIPSHNG